MTEAADALGDGRVIRDEVSEGERIAELEADALLRDARIAELVQEVEGLRAAMEHRAVIEQAKGILMHSMKCSADAAFAVLVAASQRENVKLRDVAVRIAAAQDGEVAAELSTDGG
jgi:AmiR/NasT family two-component response regulator